MIFHAKVGKGGINTCINHPLPGLGHFFVYNDYHLSLIQQYACKVDKLSRGPCSIVWGWGVVTLHLLVIKCQARSGSKLFDTLMVFPIVFLNADDKKHAKITRVQIRHMVEFTFNYDKDLGRDIRFKRNG